MKHTGSAPYQENLVRLFFTDPWFNKYGNGFICPDTSKFNWFGHITNKPATGSVLFNAQYGYLVIKKYVL